MKGNKINWQELAADMAAKAGLQRKDAEAFVRSFFDVLSKGILADKAVKVKALGTFKLVEVQERESVNVNTGERFIISGHSKIGFLPDNALKELVNKPFADFQTVILNEGTSTEEIEEINRKYPTEDADEDAEETLSISIPAAQSSSTQPEEDAMDDTVTIIPQEPQEQAEEAIEPSEEQSQESIPETSVTPETQEEQEAPESPITSETQEEQEAKEFAPKTSPVSAKEETQKTQTPETSLCPSTEQEETQVTQMQTKDQQSGHNIWRTLFLALVTVLIMIACYMAGYLRLIDMSWLCMPPAEEFTEIPAEPAAAQPKEKPAKATSAQPSETVVQEEAKPQPKDIKPQPDRNKMMEAAKNFPQMAGGKYLIVGIRGTRAMKRGDNLYRMAREEYGDKNIAEYIKALNQFPNPDNIPIGYEVKLPELYEIGK